MATIVPITMVGTAIPTANFQQSTSLLPTLNLHLPSYVCSAAVCCVVDSDASVSFVDSSAKFSKLVVELTMNVVEDSVVLKVDSKEVVLADENVWVSWLLEPIFGVDEGSRLVVLVVAETSTIATQIFITVRPVKPYQINQHSLPFIKFTK